MASRQWRDAVVVAPEGRRLLRLEARNSQTPIEKKPPWIKTRLRTGPEYAALKDLVRREGVHTSGTFCHAATTSNAAIGSAVHPANS